MDTLEEKYLKLLAEHEQLADKVEKGKQDSINLQHCGRAYNQLSESRFELINTIKDLYASWLPPKIASFLSTMKAWAKNGFRKSKYSKIRWDICTQCPNLKDEKLCTLCGCYMKRKVNLEGAKCPISKW